MGQLLDAKIDLAALRGQGICLDHYSGVAADVVRAVRGGYYERGLAGRNLPYICHGNGAEEIVSDVTPAQRVTAILSALNNR